MNVIEKKEDPNIKFDNEDEFLDPEADSIEKAAASKLYGEAGLIVFVLICLLIF
jgi:hypothetical protein